MTRSPAPARSPAALLHRLVHMWLVLQRILAGIGRALRRPWESRRPPAPRTAPAGRSGRAPPRTARRRIWR